MALLGGSGEVLDSDAPHLQETAGPAQPDQVASISARQPSGWPEQDGFNGLAGASRAT